MPLLNLEKAIGRLTAARAVVAIDQAIRAVADDAPVPQVLLRNDGWTGVTTTIDGDGWRAVLITAGGRGTTSRSCTVIGADGTVVASFAADGAARRAAAITAALVAPHMVGAAPVRLAVLGGGALGRCVINTLSGALDLALITIFDPDPAVAEAAARDVARVAEDAASAVRDATLIVTATNARDPVLRADWVGPGAAIIAVGADRRGRRELDYRIIANAAFVMCDAPMTARAIGDDLREPVADGHLDWQEVTPLRDVISGDVDARVSDDDLVVAKLIDPTPALLALARAALKR